MPTLVRGRVYPKSYAPGKNPFLNAPAHSTGGPIGTDTVPAWLSPGEFVMNANASQQYMPWLQFMNAGHYDAGGDVHTMPTTPSPQPMPQAPPKPQGAPGGDAMKSATGAWASRAPRLRPVRPAPARWTRGQARRRGRRRPSQGLQAPGATMAPSSGLQISGNGLIGFGEQAPMAALSAAASGGGDLGVGAGAGAGAAVLQQAYQIGVQELNRAVGAAGQYAAIGTEGVLEALRVSGSGAGQDWATTIPGRLLMGGVRYPAQPRRTPRATRWAAARATPGSSNPNPTSACRSATSTSTPRTRRNSRTGASRSRRWPGAPTRRRRAGEWGLPSAVSAAYNRRMVKTITIVAMLALATAAPAAADAQDDQFLHALAAQGIQGDPGQLIADAHAACDNWGHVWAVSESANKSKPTQASDPTKPPR